MAIEYERLQRSHLEARYIESIRSVDRLAGQLRAALELESAAIDAAHIHRGCLAAGLGSLEARAASVGWGMGIPREELLALVLPGALVEHDLLQSNTDS